MGIWLNYDLNPKGVGIMLHNYECPLNFFSDVDEYGNRRGQIEKVRNGAVEILDKYVH